MSDHLDPMTLSDLAGDVLSGEARARADAHVRDCDDCFARLTRLRALLADAAALPREAALPPDEWTRIRARLTSPSAAPVAAAPWWSRRGWLAAAGIALVVLSSGVTALVLEWGEQPVVPVVATSAPAIPLATRLASVEADYATVIRDLERELDEHRDALAPETIAAVERSLRVIDAAIAEAREALARDPGSETVARLLVASHDQKIELLRRATRMASQG